MKNKKNKTGKKQPVASKKIKSKGAPQERDGTKKGKLTTMAIKPSLALADADVVKITRAEALLRTKMLLMREWGLAQPPDSDTSLRDWPNGLGKNDDDIAALERPIEDDDPPGFHDVEAKVTRSNLIQAKTVIELRDRIWDGIPEKHRA